MKFLVPNYSCLQNPWLGGCRPQIPVLCPLSSTEFVEPLPKKIPGYATVLHMPKVRGSCRKEARGRRCEDFLAVSSFSSVRAALTAPYAMHYTYSCFKPAYPAQNRFTWWKPHENEELCSLTKTNSCGSMCYILHRFTDGEHFLKWHYITSYSPCERCTQHPPPTLSNTKLPSEMCQSSLRHPL
jgi:hypothetical protein